MIAEEQYLIIPRESGLGFVIREREEEPDEPRIAYDGKDHALFYRDSKTVIVLDYINPLMREDIYNADVVMVVEVNYLTEEVIRSYPVQVKKVKKVELDKSVLLSLKKKETLIKKETEKLLKK